LLVLKLDNKNISEGKGIPHAAERYAQRVGSLWGHVCCAKDVPESKVKKLLSVIEEINLYLPDDWRMTRTKNNFRVFVRIQEENDSESFVLAGRSFRQADGRIIHIVDTVLRPEHLDKMDTEAFVTKSDIGPLRKKDRSKVFDQLRMDHPELVRPNLYFLKPRPDECPSPLFARQYERVFQDNTLYEFHRIHPLTKSGLDTGIFRWIRWTCFGEATIVKHPNPLSHGRDYWNVPMIKFEKATKIVQEHKRLLEEHDISIEHGEHAESPYEIEYKLLYSGDPADRQSLFEKAEEIIKESGLFIDSRKQQVQNDTYLDDNDFSILLDGGSLRVRQTPETARITLKAKRSDSARSGGEYSRFEEEQTITVQDANAFLAGQGITARPLRVLRERLPKCGKLAPRVKVETRREILHARNKKEQEAEVCFDFVRFLSLSGKEIGRDVEIEIESKGMPIVQVARVADLLREKLNLTPSPLSKYERAFEHCPELLETSA